MAIPLIQKPSIYFINQFSLIVKLRKTFLTIVRIKQFFTRFCPCNHHPQLRKQRFIGHHDAISESTHRNCSIKLNRIFLCCNWEYLIQKILRKSIFIIFWIVLIWDNKGLRYRNWYCSYLAEEMPKVENYVHQETLFFVLEGD